MAFRWSRSKPSSEWSNTRGMVFATRCRSGSQHAPFGQSGRNPKDCI